MKRKIIYSLLIGLLFVVLSLFFKTSTQNIEPMPYTNIGNGNHVINGVVIYPQPNNSNTIAKRGLPLPIVSVRSDDDSVRNYYREINIGNLLIDFLIYSSVAFCIFYLVSVVKK